MKKQRTAAEVVRGLRRRRKLDCILSGIAGLGLATILAVLAFFFGGVLSDQVITGDMPRVMNLWSGLAITVVIAGVGAVSAAHTAGGFNSYYFRYPIIPKREYRANLRKGWMLNGALVFFVPCAFAAGILVTSDRNYNWAFLTNLFLSTWSFFAISLAHILYRRTWMYWFFALPKLLMLALAGIASIGKWFGCLLIIVLAGLAIWKAVPLINAIQSAYDWLVNLGPAGALVAMVLVPYAGIAELARYPWYINALGTLLLLVLIGNSLRLIRKRWSLTPAQIDALVWEARNDPKLLDAYPDWMQAGIQSNSHRRDDEAEDEDSAPVIADAPTIDDLPDMKLAWPYTPALPPEELLFRPFRPLTVLQSIKMSGYTFLLVLTAIAAGAIVMVDSKFAQEIYRKQFLGATLIIVLFATVAGSGGRGAWGSYADRFAPADWLRAAWVRLRYEWLAFLFLDLVAAGLVVAVSHAPRAWVVGAVLVMWLMRMSGYLLDRVGQLAGARNGKWLPAVSITLLFASLGFIVFLIATSIDMPRDNVAAIFTRGVKLLGLFFIALNLAFIITILLCDRRWSRQVLASGGG